MNAYLLEQPGDASALQLKEVPTPDRKPNELLVEVKAISINPVDAKTRAGKGMFGRLASKLPIILGWDIAGVVVAADADSKFKIGDRVFGMADFPGNGNAY